MGTTDVFRKSKKIMNELTKNPGSLSKADAKFIEKVLRSGVKLLTKTKKWAQEKGVHDLYKKNEQLNMFRKSVIFIRAEEATVRCVNCRVKTSKGNYIFYYIGKNGMCNLLKITENHATESYCSYRTCFEIETFKQLYRITDEYDYDEISVFLKDRKTFLSQMCGLDISKIPVKFHAHVILDIFGFIDEIQESVEYHERKQFQ
jgi:hypothetical protein